jgi:hypothetical protein
LLDSYTITIQVICLFNNTPVQEQQGAFASNVIPHQLLVGNLLPKKRALFEKFW